MTKHVDGCWLVFLLCLLRSKFVYVQLGIDHMIDRKSLV